MKNNRKSSPHSCTRVDCCRFDSDPKTCYDTPDCARNTSSRRIWRSIEHYLFMIGLPILFLLSFPVYLVIGICKAIPRAWHSTFKGGGIEDHCGCGCHCGCPGHCGGPPHCGGGHCGEPPCCGCKPKGCLAIVWWVIAKLLRLCFKFAISFVKDAIKKRFFGGLTAFTASSFKTPPSSRLKVAYVSVYGIPCGISTYNEYLLNELHHYCDVRVFAENVEEAAATQRHDPAWVVRCWDRGRHPKRELLNKIDDWKPDIIHIGHEYGLFPKAYQFTWLVSALKAKGYPVVATMHSIYDHVDKAVQEAAGQHIIAHTEAGKVALVKKGIKAEQITVIPHGSTIFDGTADSPVLMKPLWDTWNNKHTIFQPGFLFEYKGHKRMLNVIARLKVKYPDVHYIVQASENPKNAQEHEKLYQDLISLVDKLDIHENVTINRGFVSEDILMSHIRTVKCCVLPYANHPDHDVRATSGIARLIMATETPLVVSQVHLFDDLEGVVPRAGDEDELFDAIESVFSNPKAIKDQMEWRRAFLRKTSWSMVAYRTSAIYNDLV